MSAKKIFLLEDDPGIRDLVDYLLKANGYDVSLFEIIRAFCNNLETVFHYPMVMDLMCQGN